MPYFKHVIFSFLFTNFSLIFHSFFTKFPLNDLLSRTFVIFYSRLQPLLLPICC